MSVGPYGVWGVNSNDNVYKKTSGGWQHIPGSLSDISVGLNSVWGSLIIAKSSEELKVPTIGNRFILRGV